MGDRLLVRISAATGLAFAALDLLAGFIYPQQPRVDGPPSATVVWAHAHRVALQTGMIFGLVGAAMLLWFAGFLYSRTRPVARGAASVAPMVLGAGVGAAVVAAIAAMPIALLAFMVGQPPGIPDPTVVRLLADLNTVLFAASSALTAVFLVALGVAILRDELAAPVWLGVLCLIVSAFNACSVWVALTFTTYHGKSWNIVAFGAYIGFVLVVAMLSVSMLRDRSGRSSSATATAIA